MKNQEATVGDVVAFNTLPDAVWFDVTAVDGFTLVVRQHDTNYHVQFMDKSLVKQIRPRDRVEVERTASGQWQVTLYKAKGLNKGTTTIATLCGGLLGRELARLVGETTAEAHMIDGIEIID